MLIKTIASLTGCLFLNMGATTEKYFFELHQVQCLWQDNSIAIVNFICQQVS